jgi:hypothetical protein
MKKKGIEKYLCRALRICSSVCLVGLDGVEPSTSRLSGVRSNQTELQALTGPVINIKLSKEQKKLISQN